MVLGYPTSTSFPGVDGWSTDPWVLGRHMASLFNEEKNEVNKVDLTGSS